MLPYTFPLMAGFIAWVWILRITARVFFSQMHLWSDAAERVVMIDTYLAMLLGTGVLEGTP